MPYLPDLSQRSLLPTSCEAVRVVGWLTAEEEYATGTVDEVFFQRLKQLCSNPWQPFVSAGLHQCSLCQFDGPYCASNVFVCDGNHKVAKRCIVDIDRQVGGLKRGVAEWKGLKTLSMNGRNHGVSTVDGRSPALRQVRITFQQKAC